MTNNIDKFTSAFSTNNCSPSIKPDLFVTTNSTICLCVPASFPGCLSSPSNLDVKTGKFCFSTAEFVSPTILASAHAVNASIHEGLRV